MNDADSFDVLAYSVDMTQVSPEKPLTPAVLRCLLADVKERDDALGRRVAALQNDVALLRTWGQGLTERVDRLENKLALLLEVLEVRLP